MLSKDEPRDETRLWRIATKRFEPELSPGDGPAFSLRANPAMAVRTPGQRGKRSRRCHARETAREGARGDGPAAPRRGGREQPPLLAGFMIAKSASALSSTAKHCSAAGYSVIRAGQEPNGGDISFAMRRLRRRARSSRSRPLRGCACQGHWQGESLWLRPDAYPRA